MVIACSRRQPLEQKIRSRDSLQGERGGKSCWAVVHSTNRGATSRRCNMKRHQVPKLLTALLPCIALFGCDKPVMDAGQQAAEVQAVAEPPAEFVAGGNKAL